MISLIDTLEPLGKFFIAQAKHIGVGEFSLDSVLKASELELAKKASKEYVDEQIANIPEADVTKAYVEANFAKKTDIPAPVTKTSQLQNDSGFLTQHQSLAGYVQTTDIRLTNARPASDVSAWAKAATKPTYTKAEVGLSNVDNTSDNNKPISAATQSALNSKASKSEIVKHYKSISEMISDSTLELGNVCIVLDVDGGIYEINNTYKFGDAVALDNGYYAKKKYDKFPGLNASKSVTDGQYVYIMSFNDSFVGQSYATDKYDEFYMLNKKALNTDYPTCDPDLLWHNGKVFCANDYKNSRKFPSDIDKNVFLFNNEIHFNYTDDLKNWSETIQVNVPATFWQVFGPCFFKDDNGDVYMFFSGTTSHSKISGTNRYPVATYLIKATNNELTSWTEPQLIQLSDDKELTIDPCVVKKDGVYYLFVKNDRTGEMCEYKSNTINGAYQFVQVINAGWSNVEGYQCIKLGSKYYMYVEEVNSTRVMSTRVASSSDLITWSEFKYVNSFYDVRTKHFGAIVVDTPEKHAFFDDAIKEYGDFRDSAVSYLKKDKTFIFNTQRNVSGFTGTLKVEPNTVYMISGNDNAIISDIDSTSLKNGEMVFFYALMGRDGTGRIRFAKTDNVQFSSKRFYTIGRCSNTANMMIPFVKYSGTLWAVIPQHDTSVMKMDETEHAANDNITMSMQLIARPATNQNDLYKYTVVGGIATPSLIIDGYLYVITYSSTDVQVVFVSKNFIAGDSSATTLTATYNADTVSIDFVLKTNIKSKIKIKIDKIADGWDLN